MRKQDLNRQTPGFIQVLANRSEIRELCHVQIIESDYPQFLRDVDSKLLCDLNYAKGLKIGRRKNGRGRVGCAE